MGDTFSLTLHCPCLHSRFKSILKLVQLQFQQSNFTAMVKRYEELLTYIDAVTSNELQDGIQTYARSFGLLLLWFALLAPCHQCYSAAPACWEQFLLRQKLACSPVCMKSRCKP